MMSFDISAPDMMYSSEVAQRSWPVMVVTEEAGSSVPPEWQAAMGGRNWAKVIMPSSVAPQTLSNLEVIDGSWFRDALGIIAAAEDRYQGNSALIFLLREAEYLIAHFASWPALVRPRFSIDALGRPSFSSKSDRHYLHVTLDNEIGLNWYAEVDGKDWSEDDEDNGEFYTHLPPRLTELARTLE